MCVALPGQVKKLRPEGVALVDFNGNMVEAQAGLVRVKEGDWVLVHAGCIIQTMRSNEAEELIDIFREVERFGH